MYKRKSRQREQIAKSFLKKKDGVAVNLQTFRIAQKIHIILGF